MIDDRSHSRALHIATLVLLAAAVLAAHAGVLQNGWVLLDDPQYVFDNPHVNHGLTLAGLGWFMHHDHVGNWHPLTTAAHMLCVNAFALRPAGHHAVSLVLHVLSAVLLALALRRLTGAWWRSVLVAALFALHPLRVESVAWASELKDTLSGTFFMLTLLLYARWVARPGTARLAALAASLALGLLAKPMLVTVPCLLLVLDAWPLGRLGGARSSARGAAPPVASLGRRVREKWLLFALAAASAIVTFLVQRGSGAVVGAENLSLTARLANACLSAVRYVELSFWPHRLLPYYALTTRPSLAAGAWAALALAAFSALAIAQRRTRPWLLAGWLWYLGMLVPVIGLVQVGMQSHADRYTYLPTIGLAIALVWTLDDLLPRGRAVRALAAALACVALLALALATVRQVRWWRDNHTLFTHVLALDPHNLVAHQCIGSELLKAGDPRAALPHFEAELRAVPGFTDARIDLGTALGMLGRYDEAIVQWRAFLQLRDDASVRHNLGLALMRRGQQDEAIDEYRAALRQDPDHFETLVELATVLGKRGRIGEADALLRHAVELQPAAEKPRRMLAVTFTLEGDVEGAIAQYGELARRDTTDLDALTNIAWIRATHPDARHRDGATAVRLAELACARSKSPQGVLCSTLAAAYAEAGRLPDAVRAGARAVALASAERDTASAAAFARQLACYRAGRAFHFAPAR